MGYEANRFVETSAKTFAVIEHLADVGSMGVSELARELDMSKGIAHNHLSTLRELGYVCKEEERYRLSPKFIRLGYQTRTEYTLYRSGHAVVDRLANQFETTTVLVQRQGSNAIVLYAACSDPSPEIKVGDAIPLSSSLVGVAMLATEFSGEHDEVDPVTAESSPLTIDTVIEDLSEQGYIGGPMTAVDSSDGVAVPLVDDSGHCRGGLGTFLPETDGNNKQRLGNELRTARNRIENRFDSDLDTERSFATEKHSWFGG